MSGTRCADPLCGHTLAEHDAADGQGCVGVIEHPATGPADDFEAPWSERCFCLKFHETFQEDPS